MVPLIPIPGVSESLLPVVKQIRKVYVFDSFQSFLLKKKKDTTFRQPGPGRGLLSFHTLIGTMGEVTNLARGLSPADSRIAEPVGPPFAVGGRETILKIHVNASRQM